MFTQHVRDIKQSTLCYNKLSPRFTLDTFILTFSYIDTKNDYDTIINILLANKNIQYKILSISTIKYLNVQKFLNHVFMSDIIKKSNGYYYSIGESKKFMCDYEPYSPIITSNHDFIHKLFYPKYQIQHDKKIEKIVSKIFDVSIIKNTFKTTFCEFINTLISNRNYYDEKKTIKICNAYIYLFDNFEGKYNTHIFGAKYVDFYPTNTVKYCDFLQIAIRTGIQKIVEYVIDNKIFNKYDLLNTNNVSNFLKKVDYEFLLKYDLFDCNYAHIYKLIFKKKTIVRLIHSNEYLVLNNTLNDIMLLFKYKKNTVNNFFPEIAKNFRTFIFTAPSLTNLCIKGNIQLVELLLENGVNPNSLDIYNTHPLISLCSSKNAINRLDMVKLLIKHGANVNYCITEGISPPQGCIKNCTPLSQAKKNNLVKIIELLINNGAH
jgi:hypothetical protein